MTNPEGRVLLRRKAVDPPPGVRTDLQIWRGIADRLGRGSFFPTEPEEVFDELRRASAGGIADYAGITYERIAAGEELFWPCPTEDHPGTPRLFLDRFATPDGRANFLAVRPRVAAELPDADHPYLLTTGRARAQYQSGTQTRRSPTLAAAVPRPYVELHPELARVHGIAEGDLVRLSTPRASAVLDARLDPGIRRDTVFVPFHWGGAACVNALVSDALDPTSRMPEFKTCPVAAGEGRRDGARDERRGGSADRLSPNVNPIPPFWQRGDTDAQHAPLPAGDLPVRGPGGGQARSPARGADLHRADGRHHPTAVLPRRQQHGRAGHRRPACATAPRCATSRSARATPCTCRSPWSRTSTTTPCWSCTSPRARGSTGTVVVDLGLVEV